MHLKLNELEEQFSKIIAEGSAKDPSSEMPWHSNTSYVEPQRSIEVPSVHFETNALVRTAEKDVDLEEKLLPFGEIEDMIEKAHPKSIYVSEALGDGGLVENQNEQHDKMVAITMRHPSGTNTHKMAETISALVKIANELDALGDEEAVREIDAVLESISDSKKKDNVRQAAAPVVLPFIGAVALWKVLFGAGAAGAAGAGTLWWQMSGKSHGLLKDIAKVKSSLSSLPPSVVDKPRLIRSVNELEMAVAVFTNIRGKALETAAPAPQIIAKLKESLLALQEKSTALSGNIDAYAAITKDGTFFLKNHMDSINQSVSVMAADLGKIEADVAAAMQAPGTGSNDAAAVFETPRGSNQLTEGVTPRESKQTAAPTPQAVRPVSQLQNYLRLDYGIDLDPNGVINKAWAKEIAKIVYELRRSMRTSAMIEDPDSAAKTARSLTVNRILRVRDDGNYDLMMSPGKFQALVQLAEEAENMSEQIAIERRSRPAKE